MDLREMILQEHSKENCLAIVQWVGSSRQKFNQLFILFLKGEYWVTQRASWPLSYCVEQHPSFIERNFNRLIAHLEKDNLHDAVKRNGLRLLQFVDIPGKYRGRLMNICFKFLENPGEAVAVKAFSLTLLTTLAKQYPAIIPEVKILIEDQWPHQTAAFKSSAQAFLRMAAR